jgi:sugar phosphate isomerase/epimerase
MMRAPLPLAYSCNGFTQRSLSEALTLIHQCGYSGVELLGDRPHWRPEHSTEASARSTRDHLEQLNLEVSNVNGNTAMFAWPDWMPETLFEPALSHHDASVRQRRIDSTFALLDWAAAVGAPRVSVTSGRCPAAVPPQEGIRWFADSLATLCERARSLGLQLSVEYEPGLLIERWRELKMLIDLVDDAALGANLDLGHAWCAGEDPHEAIRGLSGRIWNVHLEDIRAQKHYHLIPGEGDLPLGAYLETLREVDYQGMVTVELYTYADAPNGGDVIAAQQAHDYLYALKERGGSPA